VANDTKTGGIPSYSYAVLFRTLYFVAKLTRYFYNATFSNLDLFPGSRVYHSSEIGIEFGNHPRGNATGKEVALSKKMQSVRAGFAQQPLAGLGSGEVLQIGVFGSDGFKVKSEDEVDGSYCEL
jgi:hypothetical protein